MKKCFVLLTVAILAFFVGTGVLNAEETYFSIDTLDSELFEIVNPPWEGYTFNINGALDAGSGNVSVMSINGIQYEKGLWMHAGPSTSSHTTTSIDISGMDYTGFYAYVGVDDAMGGNGTVYFKIYGDGELLAQSPIMKGSHDAYPLSCDITGVEILDLVVENSGDNHACDWSDWGDAKFGKGTYVPYKTPDPVATPSPVPYEKGKDMYLSDMDRNLFYVPELSFDGYEVHYDENSSYQKLTVNDVAYDKGIWMHANPEYDLSSLVIDVSQFEYTSFSAAIGIDDAMGAGGSCEFIVYADGKEVYMSDCLRNDSETVNVLVNIAGAKKITLVLTNGGDDHSADWGEWCDAKFGFESLATPKPVITQSPTIKPTASPTPGNTTEIKPTATNPTKPTDTEKKPSATSENDLLYVIIIIVGVVVIAIAVIVIIKKNRKK